MRKIGTLLIISLYLIMGANAQRINSKQSVVNFTTEGMFGADVKGTFTGMKGEVRFDPTDLSNANFDVTIDAASVFTDNGKRDNHLKNEDFFDVESYLTIGFKSISVEKTDLAYQTVGELTMHGITQPATITFTYDDKKLVGQIEINRLDYKVAEGVKASKVAEMTQIEIICVLN